MKVNVNKNRKSSYFSIVRIGVMLSVVVAILVACQNPFTAVKWSSPSVQPNPSKNPATAQPTIMPSPTASLAPTAIPTSSPTDSSKKTEEIRVFYTDEQLTGLELRHVVITYQTEEEKILRTIQNLQTPQEEHLLSLFQNIEVNSIQFHEQYGDLQIDFHIPGGNLNFGSTAEGFFLQILTETLFQFDNIQDIYLTIDGSQVETLAGHIELPYPILRNYR